MAGEITKAHDRLFKKIESVKENFRDLVESTFPKELLENLKLDTLKLDTNNYIDEELQEFYSDIVYNCHYKGGTAIKISILYEHKSYKPDNEYLQLLRYILSIWEFQTANREELSVVIPVIFYHGKKAWKYRTIFDLLNCTDTMLHNFIPNFTYLLTDLHDYSDHEITNEIFRNNINKVMTLLFKHMKEEEYLRKRITGIFSMLKSFFGTRQTDVILPFRWYIIYTTEIGSDYLTECLNTISPGGGNEVMTTAMKLLQQGKIETAKKMLAKGYPIEEICDITDLSKEQILEACKDESPKKD